jgi:hypothetical protein
MVYKKMDAAARLELVRGLRLVDLLSTITATPDALAPADDEEDDAAAGAAGAGKEASVADFGTTVAQLLMETGRGLLAAAESPGVIASQEALTWTAGAIRACGGMALGILAHVSVRAGVLLALRL